MDVLIRASKESTSRLFAESRSFGQMPGLDSRFPSTIGLEQAVDHRGWREAREMAIRLVLSGPSLILVVGPPGVGKTLLLLELDRALRAAGVDVLLLRRGTVDDAEVAAFKGRTTNRGRAVLIDEAHRLTRQTLGRLAQLGACAFALSGISDREGDRLGNSPAGSEATILRLGPLKPKEVGDFLISRLTQAGLPPDLLSSEAVAQLAKHSDGVPRVLNVLASAALFLARADGVSRVGAAHVNRAAALRDGGSETCLAEPAAIATLSRSPAAAHKPPLRRSLVLAAVVLFAGGSLAASGSWLVMQHNASEGRGTPEPQPVQASVPPAAPPVPVQPAEGPPERSEKAARPAAPDPEPGAPAIAPAEIGAAPLPSTAAPEQASLSTALAPKPETTEPAPSVPPSPDSDGSDLATPTAPISPRAMRHRAAQSRPEAPGSHHTKADHSISQDDPPPPGSSAAQASPDHQKTGYIGIFTTGPDGTRMFRSMP